MQLDGELRLAGDGLGPPPLVREPLADSRPEVAIVRVVAGHRVVGDGNPRNLDDARLDRVHQREVGDHPGEERPLGVAGPRGRTASPTGRRWPRRRSSRGPPPAPRSRAGPPPSAPRPRCLLPVELLRLVVGLAAVAVVRLVVDDDDLALVAQLVADAVDHLLGRLGEARRRREDLLRQPAARPSSRGLKAWKLVMTIFARPSRPMVRRDDVELADSNSRVVRQRTRSRSRIVMPGVTIEERVGEPVIPRDRRLVQHLPRDQHRHDDRLAPAGGHLQRDAVESRVRRSLASRRYFSIQTSPIFLAASVM